MPDCRQCPKEAEVVVEQGTINKSGPEYFCKGCYLNLCNHVSGCHFGSDTPPPAKHLNDGSPFWIQPSTYHYPGFAPISGIPASGTFPCWWESVAGTARRKKDIVDAAQRIIDE